MLLEGCAKAFDEARRHEHGFMHDEPTAQRVTFPAGAGKIQSA
jgi:hypothetical protein